MNKIGLILTINKFKQYFQSSQMTWSCDSLEEAKYKLIEYIANEFYNVNIDYPFDLLDFEHHWFGQQYTNTNAFNYKIFMEGEWHNPWDDQEIYSDVLAKIQAAEESNPPNFDELYGEPDGDGDAENNSTMEQNDEIHELEKKLTEIIKESKKTTFKEDQVKECKCDKCKENHPEETDKENHPEETDKENHPEESDNESGIGSGIDNESGIGSGIGSGIDNESGIGSGSGRVHSHEEPK
jgi:hypothetical protein